MKNLFKITLITAFGMIALQSCSDDDSPSPVVATEASVVENYAKMVHADYTNSLESAKALQTTLKAFTAAPSEAGLVEAKKVWLAAREDYSVTEVYRGSNGPIDAENGASWDISNEGQINAWPLNEVYIDYVQKRTDYTGKDGIYAVGIVQGTDAITKEFIAGKNEFGGDAAAVSTGWHAIEFLLWGQDDKKPSNFTSKDLSLNKSAGNRPFTDYTTKEGAERRKQFLNVAAELLVDDLQDLVNTWATGGTYNKVFMGLNKKTALKNIIEGPQFLAASELSNERMLAPAINGVGFGECGQEDEHSCFSDNTHRDVYLNAKGIVNVLNNTGFVSLVTAKDATQGAKLVAEINKMWASIELIDNTAKQGTPFDVMVMNEGKGKEGIVMKGDLALKNLGDVIRESAAKLGISTTLSYE